MIEAPTFISRAARWTRFRAPGRHCRRPRPDRDHAAQRIPADDEPRASRGDWASSGYLMTSMGHTTQDKFFLVDTAKQVICTFDVKRR